MGAYWLLHSLRLVAPKRSRWRGATFATIRSVFVKIAVRVEELTRIARLKIEKQNAERAELRERIVAMFKQHGFEIGDLFGKGRKGKGTVAVKYRDPH